MGSPHRGYTVRVNDTHPEIERRIIDGYRRMTAARKLERVADLTRTCRALALARLRGEHPNASERELALRLASLRFDRETMIRAFAWDPQAHGA
jgi:hypothetical protein